MNDCNPNADILIHMSWLNMDAVRVRQLFAFFIFFALWEMLAVWDDDIFLNKERGNQGNFFSTALRS